MPGISCQMKKEVCFNMNQLIWTYLFNVGVKHAHSVLFSSDINQGVNQA